jgi:ABC-type transport system involved in multi-copper enzyme maturation permease subunit
MMLLFRRLADEGRIVVMVTHKFEKFFEMHRVLILARGGRLAFFGPPQEALSYFGCNEPTDIYRRLGAGDPDVLSQAYRSSIQYERYINERITEAQQVFQTLGETQPGTPESQVATPRIGLSQWLTLSRRYLEVKLKDRRNTMLLLAQAPIIAVILSIIIGRTLNDAKTVFMAAIIAVWFGTNNAIREIVAEGPIYQRERLFNLKIPSYVLSKFTVLSLIGLIQCALFLVILIGFGLLRAQDFFLLMLVIFLTSLAGGAMGLFFSAVVRSTEKAMSVLPLILIPQLLLSGYLVPVADLYVNESTGRPARAADYDRYQHWQDSQRAAANAKTAPPQTSAPPDPVGKQGGLGPVRYASDVIVVRWTIDALALFVSIGDKKARDALPTNFTVAQYDKVLEGRPEAEINSTYRRGAIVDLAILAGFSVLALGLAMLALKRKDAL